MSELKIVITGCTGFVGKHLTAYLRDKYPAAELIGVARKRVSECNGLNLLYGDLTDLSFCQEILEQHKPSMIFHLAGNPFSENFSSCLQDNLVAFHSMATAALNLKLETSFVIVGSAAEYGYVSDKNLPVSESLHLVPVSDYGYAKSCQTALATYFFHKGLNIKVARIFNILGPGISEKLVIGTLLSQLKAGEKNLVLKGPTDSQRDFLDILDVCSGLDVIMQKGAAGEIYNLCAGFPISIRDLANLLEAQVPGVNVSGNDCPDQKQKQDVSVIYGDNKKLRELCWSPLISLEESINLMVSSCVGVS